MTWWHSGGIISEGVVSVGETYRIGIMRFQFLSRIAFAGNCALGGRPWSFNFSIAFHGLQLSLLAMRKRHPP